MSVLKLQFLLIIFEVYTVYYTGWYLKWGTGSKNWFYLTGQYVDDDFQECDVNMKANFNT